MKLILFIFSLLLVIVLVGAYAPRVLACGGFFEPSCEGTNQVVQDNEKRLEQAVPIPQLSDSLERKNISKRLQLFSNPNKISYIYLVSYGKVMAFYTIKGKITSGSKRLTPNQTLLDDCGNIVSPGENFPCHGAGTVDAPELDGTYGQSAQYIFFWTTDGVYVQWSGDYMLADQPLQLSTPPEMVLQAK